MWHTLGVDLGSTTAKAVVVAPDGRPVSSSIVQMGAVSKKGVERAIAAALEDGGLTRGDIVRTVSTGYGRRLVELADRSFTEISCHARGAVAMMPGVRLVIDIGGQDSKAIAIGQDGLLDRFAINDRCASGTGRFFDVLSRALEVEVTDISDLAAATSHEAEVSGMCATFAETEVISLLAQDVAPADISAAVMRSVASRTVGLVAQVRKNTPVVMTGGVAQNASFVAELSRQLDLSIGHLDEPQIAGALGAALIARDDYLSTVPDDERMQTEWDRQRSGSPIESCQDCDGAAGDDRGPVPVTLMPTVTRV
ncbi:CoA-substrate-specific enzyme activase, putative [Brevibacterium sandarakinum]|uniref:CoA-substrate-specific enzyme activase, putative n=1 Tax=Brevibacterium sandarakinum TaxID=629680 RepID=A0A1H1SR30_BRESA|nr:acyl-CoA dehydratase activase [Brevibacterium sandarakinum]SDS50313.1 CoA-substrate-specific enzyme activase, putative [Brevibacterium sandarakinum]